MISSEVLLSRLSRLSKAVVVVVLKFSMGRQAKLLLLSNLVADVTDVWKYNLDRKNHPKTSKVLDIRVGFMMAL